MQPTFFINYCGDPCFSLQPKPLRATWKTLEDHRLPLMVAAGAACGETAIVDFHGHALSKLISGFRFG